jgi:DNA topoisomerase-1
MSKPLVIVESPSKAKTISKYLKGEYHVKASVGHIRDLPKSKLGVDVENSFNPTYQILKGKEKIVEELKAAAEKADSIYLAADPDREGEAICWHLKQLLDDNTKKFHRVVMNEITQGSVSAAFNSPIAIDMNKVNAQQARRIIDRLVGYKISPILWDKVRRGLSAGRVQSIAVKIICDREKDISAFVPVEYWNIDVHLSADKPPVFIAKLIKEKDKKIEVGNQEKADEIVAKLKKAEFAVSSLKRKEKKKYPYPPFITSRLQQAAANRLGYTVKRTMSIAQRLYEGIEIGESGPVGLITYMRTDSVRIAPEALNEVREYISKTYTDKYLPEKPNYYRSRKSAQEAHEAIRPTSAFRTPESMRKHLSDEEFKLYRLIWEQFVTSQMLPAIYDTTTVEIKAGEFDLRATGSILKFDGYQILMKPFESEPAREKGEKEEAAEDEDDGANKVLPPLVEGQKLSLQKIDPTQHFTQPPPRFNEASLVKELEANGIGRPSTYASIVSTIQNREYVEKVEKRFKPTELGMLVNDLLAGSFVDIMKTEYTAGLEVQLDEIEDGKRDWIQTLQKFNADFETDLNKAQKEMRNVKTEQIETEEICDKCGKTMVIKWGRFGKFLACSGYPDCRNTREIVAKTDGAVSVVQQETKQCPNCGKEMVLRRGRWGFFLACSGYPNCKTTESVDPKTLKPKEQEPIKENCPECGNPLVRKYGRFGEFIACSSYPKCKYIRKNTIGIKCPVPGCGGEVVENKSKRGTKFYGCTNYPKCNFTASGKPIDKPCPKCDFKYLLEKVLKRKGTVHYCHNKECGYEEVVAPPVK